MTGHYHLGNGYRQFNPVLMRFNSPDSWSPFGEGGLNAYAYCEGDPTNRIDPNGHSFKGIGQLIGRKLGLRPSKKITKLAEDINTGTVDFKQPNFFGHLTDSPAARDFHNFKTGTPPEAMLHKNKLYLIETSENEFVRYRTSRRIIKEKDKWLWRPSNLEVITATSRASEQTKNIVESINTMLRSGKSQPANNLYQIFYPPTKYGAHKKNLGSWLGSGSHSDEPNYWRDK